MDKLIQVLDRKSWLLFLIFSVITLALYSNTAYAGFVTDFLGWQEQYDSKGFSGIINCFGYNGLHQLQHLIFYTIYYVFGSDSMAWYIIFSTLHAGVAYAMYWVFTRIFNDFSFQNSAPVVLLSAFLFLVSPYQGEVLIWRVCIHYLMMAYCFIFSIWFVHKWLMTKEIKYIIYQGILLTIGLFMLELPLAIPFLSGFYVLIWSLHFNEGGKLFQNLVKTLTSQLSIVAAWFTLNKLFLGEVVGHYGVKDHLSFDPTVIFSTLLQYLTKHLFFQRYWPHNIKMGLGETLKDPYILAAIVCACILLFILALVYFKHLSSRFRLAGLMLLLFFTSLLPVANLFLNMLQYVENDRYGYVASIFLSLFIGLLVMGMPKLLRGLCIVALFGFSIHYTVLTNNCWENATIAHYKMYEKFRFYDDDDIIILNTPENFEGAPIMWTVNEFDSMFKEGLGLKDYQPYTGNMIEVTNYNITSVTDGVHVDVINSTHLKIECNQWGTWFWRVGHGALNYENDLYSVNFSLRHYDLHIKKLLPNTKFIFWNGNDWEVVNRNI